MICLDATTQTLELQTSTTASTDFAVSFIDNTTTAFTPGSNQGNVAAATTTTIVAAPAASTQRGIKAISVYNRSTTTSNTVTIKKDVSATEYLIVTAVLQPGDSLQYAGTEAGGWAVVDSVGRVKLTPVERVGYSGRTSPFFKSSTGADAAGYWYCTSKDTGFPGAWAPGTPGLAGRATDGTTAADAGCFLFQNPATGSMFLTGAEVNSSVVSSNMVFDCLWVNSGIVVTTTTPQAINSVAFPARDVDGTVNGKGCMIGLLVTATLGNAAVNNTATVSYTNEAGTAGRTATLVAVVGAQIPATALIGTIVWFLLQAGDAGVQSIQSITLAASLTSGSVSLLVGRPIVWVPTSSANAGVQATGIENPGVRLFDGTCMLHCHIAGSTAATVFTGELRMMER